MGSEPQRGVECFKNLSVRMESVENRAWEAREEAVNSYSDM